MRTWVPVNHDTVRMSGAIAPAYDPRVDTAKTGNKMWRENTRMNVDLQVAPFKHAYALLDDAGNPVAEPDEDKLGNVRCMRTCALWIFRLFQLVVFLGIVGYFLFRFYVWSCYRHFTWDTIAIERGATFPISNANLHLYVKDCHERYDGTGLSKGSTNGVDPLADACRPNASSIIYYCENLPPTQPRPEAFTMLAHEYLGVDLKSGVKCFHGLCKLRDDLKEYDTLAVWIALAAILLTFACRFMMNNCIKGIRKQNQKSMGDEQKQRLGNRSGASYGSPQGRR